MPGRRGLTRRAAAGSTAKELTKVITSHPERRGGDARERPSRQFFVVRTEPVCSSLVRVSLWRQPFDYRCVRAGRL